MERQRSNATNGAEFAQSCQFEKSAGFGVLQGLYLCALVARKALARIIVAALDLVKQTARISVNHEQNARDLRGRMPRFASQCDRSCGRGAGPTMEMDNGRHLQHAHGANKTAGYPRCFLRCCDCQWLLLVAQGSF
jgi:hypothetical protein